MFDTVFDRLGEGRAVGIFPEGGSHDRTQFLELKAGVAIMALGAAAKYEGLPVYIVPVGLTYFNGHRFRSRVFVDFGDAISISDGDNWVARYKEGGASKRGALGEVMGKVLDSLRSVTVQAEDHETLQLFWALRRLYSPSVGRMDTVEMQKLTRGFADGWDKVKDEPKVKELVARVTTYCDLLKQYGVHDYAVSKRIAEGTADDDIISSTEVFFTLVWRVLTLAGIAVAVCPSYILFLPVVVVARNISHQKQKEALAGSKVKIEGKDVVGTWKVMISFGLMPLLHIVYTLIFRFVIGESWAVLYFFFAPFVQYAALQVHWPRFV